MPKLDSESNLGRGEHQRRTRRGRRETQNPFGREALEDERRILVTGFSFDHFGNDYHQDFAVSATKRNGVFSVSSSIVDLSSIFSKDDPTDTAMHEQKESFFRCFVPGAIFQPGDTRPAFTVFFDFAHDSDGVLQIINPDIRESQLLLKGNLPFHEADRIMTSPRSPRIATLVELAPLLVRRKNARVGLLETESFSPLSNIDLLKELRLNLVSATNEAFAQYCIEHEIPVIFGQLNPDSGEGEFTTTPRPDWVPSSRITNPQTQWISTVNARQALAYKRSEEFPYPTTELEDIADEFTDYLQVRGNRRSVAINFESRRRAISRMSREELRAMPNELFRQLTVDVFQRGINPRPLVFELIQDELAERMINGTALNQDLRDVLFVLENTDGQYDQLQEEAIQAIYTHDEYANLVFGTLANQGWKRKTIQYATIVENEEVFDTFVVAEGQGRTYLSKTFRAHDKETSTRLAGANIISQLLQIPEDVDYDILANVDVDFSVLSLDERRRVFGSKVRFSETEESEIKNLNMSELTTFCEQNGFEISVVDNSIMPERTIAPYSSGIAVIIGNFVVADERRSTSFDLAQANAARILCLKLRGPDITERDFPQDIEAEIQRMRRESNLPELQTTIQQTIDPDGNILKHCIYFLEEFSWLNYIGTGNTEEEARSLAQKKLYIGLQERAEKRTRKEQ